MTAALVIGLGNRLRGDDALGPLVLDGLREKQIADVELVEAPGDSLGLINAWQDRGTVCLVDACCDPGQEDGTIITVDNVLVDRRLLAHLHHPTSSHVLDLEQAIGMSEAMGSAPARLALYAVVGSRFEPGTEPGAAVATAARQLVGMLTERLSPPPTEVTKPCTNSP